jgi:hypothetical protein
MENKIKALAKFLDVEKEDAELYIERGEYFVLTDDEADEKAYEYIKESLWAFNASFICDMCSIDRAMVEAIQAMQEKKCESCNDAILRMVEGSCGLDDFVKEAISADGRGHFISQYDGNENEEGEFFIYRMN